MTPVIVGAGGHGRDIAAFTGWPMVDENPDLGRPLGEPGLYVAGVNDPLARWMLAWRLEQRGWTAVNDGIIVFPGAHIGPDVELGSHVHVNAGAFLTRCKVGDCSTIGPNATVCGDVEIGMLCQIGAGAVVRNLVTIGNHVTIGAGAVVVSDILEPGTYVGVPARPIVESRRYKLSETFNEFLERRHG